MKRILWIIRMAARNLNRNYRRNLTIGMAIAISFAGILLFSGFVVWVEKTLRYSTVYLNQTGHLTVARPGALENQLSKPETALMDETEQKALLAILKDEAGIEMVGRGLSSFAMVSKDCRNRGVMLIGRDTTIDRANIKNVDLIRWAGQGVHKEYPDKLNQFRASGRSALAVFPTPPLREFIYAPVEKKSNEGCEASEPGSLILLGWDIDGRLAAADGFVIGEQSTGLSLLDERAPYLPVDDIQKLLGTEQIGSIHIYLKSLANIPGAWKSLREKIAQAQLNLEVLPFFDEQVGLFYIGSLAFVGAVACFFVLLIALVVGLTLFSLFSVSVTERSSEIGLLLSLGFPEAVVEKIFVMENFLLTLIGLSTGGLVAYAAGESIIAANIRFEAAGAAGDTRLTIAWEPWVVLALGLLFFAVILFCIRLVVRSKFKKTLIQLLQEAGAL